MFSEVKKHPYLIGGIILGVIVLFFISSSGSTPGTTVADSSSDVAAANSIAETQQNANTQIAMGQLSLQGLREQIGGAVTVATLQAHTADNANTLAASVAAQQITAAQDVANTANTLSAQTQQRYFQSQENQLAISTAGTNRNAEIITGALVKQQEIAAGVQSQAIAANEHVATQSWWDKIF